jgi:energy-coupling factor transport system ATP-binding protein
VSVLAFEAVTYTYPEAGAPALRELSLMVEPGEFVVVAGLSASGKSTLLRAACGLVPHFHGGTFAGRVTVGGLDTRDHGPGELAAVAGTVFQDPETQILMGTVRAELAFPLENRGHSAASVARGVEEAALALGIERLLERTTRELSGGELQRVALAAALAGRPELVLLDEPTSQLDPVAGDELISLLRRLNEQWGAAVVMIEHRLERCLSAADRVLALAGGSSPATRRRPPSSTGPRGRRRRSRRRAPACSRARACARPRPASRTPGPRSAPTACCPTRRTHRRPTAATTAPTHPSGGGGADATPRPCASTASGTSSTAGRPSSAASTCPSGRGRRWR